MCGHTPAGTGFVLWLTGLSGAGKTTLAQRIENDLRRRGVRAEVLDGDVVRQRLTAGLGFSRADRDENVRRVAFVANLLARNGVAVVVALISPYGAARNAARQETTNFVEVFVDCALDVCIQRDVKGLYARAIAGEIPEFTGISDPYEAPAHPEIVVHTDAQTVDESANTILAYLESRGLV